LKKIPTDSGNEPGFDRFKKIRSFPAWILTFLISRFPGAEKNKEAA